MDVLADLPRGARALVLAHAEWAYDDHSSHGWQGSHAVKAYNRAMETSIERVRAIDALLGTAAPRVWRALHGRALVASAFRALRWSVPAAVIADLVLLPSAAAAVAVGAALGHAMSRPRLRRTSLRDTSRVFAGLRLRRHLRTHADGIPVRALDHPDLAETLAFLAAGTEGRAREIRDHLRSHFPGSIAELHAVAEQLVLDHASRHDIGVSLTPSTPPA